jgi:protein arginine N-methyltransferase 1
MVEDGPRAAAFLAALSRHVTPHTFLLELGSGPAFFALAAARMGARRVVAVEPDASLQLGKTAARACGLDGAVEFIRGLSWDCTLDEPADVLVSDLRGALPLYEQHIPAVIDARKRLLKPGGAMIGQRDFLYAAAVEASETYAELTSPWRNAEFDLVFEEASRCVLNDFHRIDPKPEQLLTAPVCWAVLDYRTIDSPDVSAMIEMRVKRGGVGHGLVLWFDAELAPGIGFSNAPGQPKLVYGRRFLPWLGPVHLEAGDAVQVEIHANLVGNEYIWRWNTVIPGKVCFQQSTFYSQPLWKEDLRKRAGNYAPSLNEDGEIAAFVLNRMNGNSTVKEIAAALQARFPARFKDPKAALAKAGEIARAFGR